jgi:hypothetical protein
MGDHKSMSMKYKELFDSEGILKVKKGGPLKMKVFL